MQQLSEFLVNDSAKKANVTSNTALPREGTPGQALSERTTHASRSGPSPEMR
jgi:hypothetical protein